MNKLIRFTKNTDQLLKKQVNNIALYDNLLIESYIYFSSPRFFITHRVIANCTQITRSLEIDN